MTPIDEAHLRAETAGTDEARLAFYERLAEAELHLLLQSSDKETMSPRLLDFEGARYAFAFDLPDRLEAFAGEAATATLSCRQLARMLASERLGLALNLEDAPSAQLLPPEAIDWLLRTLSHAPAEEERRVSTITPPGNLPELLLVALDSKLRLAAGLARQAYLVGVTYTDRSRSHMLGIVDPVPGAEPDLARAVSEALIFSGLDAGSLDVTFLRASQPFAATLARHGLRIDLPDPPATGPVRAPDAPPRLR
ncbi:SseB family protein [uncultured Jannaschia sp.]|uniref:SseB family protein n=1 Tax=uncultured Jannaschia sp. TaxID=293347 RepID=UPI0026339673|nr:SseB family protein [uncultured Jannaschia sp.]